MLPHTLLSMALAAPAMAQRAGSIIEAGDTLVSAMMMFLGNDEKVYMMDKVEGNKEQINGHPGWASVWDIKTKKAELMDFRSNPFCSSGLHLPNGSFATFGGNGAMGPAGVGAKGDFDDTYKNFDGRKSIRIVNPCTGPTSSFNDQCKWYDDASTVAMIKNRWYSTAEAMADGRIAIIGGFTNGGYINRNFPPGSDPDYGGAAENTYEIFPSPDGQALPMQFMRQTSGLNAYSHAFTMPSGQMFVQANFSTILWNPLTNVETPLPDVPDRVVRVYPASGAVAMLPLTPKNNYVPTMLLCGGMDEASMGDADWGSYEVPRVDTWKIRASKDCQRITPEPADKSDPKYIKDDVMFDGRTMGQFITLPTGKLVIVNGGRNGTAGYADHTGVTKSLSDMAFGMSLAAEPLGKPAMYDPEAPAGSRWSNDGFDTSSIPRLYHSSAILLPDASILIAGSNPNVDVNLSTIFPTEYRAEVFYPPYFAAATRPTPSGMPKTISYGGDSFDITIPPTSYSGAANDAADNSTVVLIRPGWTTHGMNMGQRFLQLNNTYTVKDDGSIVLHTSQHPPNANLVTPGPALLFVVVNGIPSVGTSVIVGNGLVGIQKVSPAAALPGSVRLDTAKGSASGDSTSGTGSDSKPGDKKDGSGLSMGVIIGGIVGAVAIVAVIGAIIGICLARRRRAAAAATTSAYAPAGPGAGYAMEVPKGGGYANVRASGSSAFVPLQDNMSSANLAYGAGGGYNNPSAPYSYYDHADSRASFGGPPMQDPSYTPSAGYDGQYHNPGVGRHVQQPSYDAYYDDSRMR